MAYAVLLRSASDAGASAAVGFDGVEALVVGPVDVLADGELAGALDAGGLEGGGLGGGALVEGGGLLPPGLGGEALTDADGAGDVRRRRGACSATAARDDFVGGPGTSFVVPDLDGVDGLADPVEGWPLALPLVPGDGWPEVPGLGVVPGLLGPAEPPLCPGLAVLPGSFGSAFRPPPPSPSSADCCCFTLSP